MVVVPWSFSDCDRRFTLSLREFSKTLVQQFSQRATQEFNPRNQLFAAVFSRMSEAFEGKRKSCWCSAYAPFEFIALFDLIPLPVEVLAGLLAMNRGATELLDKGSESLECRDTCGFIRACTGGIESDVLPIPDVLIRSTHFCIGGDKLFHVAEDKYKLPYFLFDACRPDIPNAVEFYARQLEDTFHQLEDLLGVTVTDSKVREVFEYSNKSSANLAEIAELTKHIPTPIRASHIAALPWFLTSLLGSQDGVEVSQLFVDEIKENIKNNNFPIPGERYRVFMRGGQPWYPNPLHRWLGVEKKVAVIAAPDFKRPFGIAWEEPLDPRDPFISMARKAVYNVAHDRYPVVVEQWCQWVDDYHIEGIIQFCPWGCHVNKASVPSIKEFVTRRNIPFVEINVDTCDERNFDFGQIQSQIELFLSLLDQRKKAY